MSDPHGSCLGAHGVPGFAVDLVTRDWVLAERMEFDVGDPGKQVNREDVPKLGGDDVGHEEVDLCGGVDASMDASASVNAVRAFADTGRGFDLNAREAASGFDDEVVAITVSPGFGDAETEGGGFVKESGFGDLAAAFGGER